MASDYLTTSSGKVILEDYLERNFIQAMLVLHLRASAYGGVLPSVRRCGLD